MVSAGSLAVLCAVGWGELPILVLFLAYVLALVACAIKAQWVMFVFGIFFVIPALVGAWLPARPGSLVAKRGQKP